MKRNEIEVFDENVKGRGVINARVKICFEQPYPEKGEIKEAIKKSKIRKILALMA